MNTEAFVSAYSAYRNGTDEYHRASLFTRLICTDGVKECADSGCWWLLDIIGSEVIPYLAGKSDMAFKCVIEVTKQADASGAVIEAYVSDGCTDRYVKHMDYADIADGKWMFILAMTDADPKISSYIMCLPSED